MTGIPDCKLVAFEETLPFEDYSELEIGVILNHNIIYHSNNKFLRILLIEPSFSRLTEQTYVDIDSSPDSVFNMDIGI